MYRVVGRLHCCLFRYRPPTRFRDRLEESFGRDLLKNCEMRTGFESASLPTRGTTVGSGRDLRVLGRECVMALVNRVENTHIGQMDPARNSP